jgi:hypothetical protein
MEKGKPLVDGFNLTVAITGASGAVFGRELLLALEEGHPVDARRRSNVH